MLNIESIQFWTGLWIIEFGILGFVILDNYFKKRNECRPNAKLMKKWQKRAKGLFMFVVLLIILTTVGLKEDKDLAYFLNSIWYAFLFLTASLWVTRDLTDRTDKKLDEINERLTTIQERLEGIHKKRPEVEDVEK